MTENNEKFHLSKWKLQDVAADVLGDDWGTSSCLRGQFGSQTCVHVSEKTGKAHYSGLKTCSSVWVCPICSVKISTRRRDEIQEALSSVNGSALIPVLVTYTLQHSLKDKLSTLVDDLKDAQRYMLNGRFRKEFYNRFDVAGYIRSVEIRWSSKNGWHPHGHELLLLKSPQSPEEIKAFLMGRYGKRLAAKGYLVNDHTIDVRGGDIDAQETVSDYLTKSSIEMELTSGSWKTGASISPFQLLSAYYETVRSLPAMGVPGNMKPQPLMGKDGHRYVYANWQNGASSLPGIQPKPSNSNKTSSVPAWDWMPGTAC